MATSARLPAGSAAIMAVAIEVIAVEGEEVLGALMVDPGQPVEEVPADLLHAAEEAEATVVGRHLLEKFGEGRRVGRRGRAHAERETRPGGELGIGGGLGGADRHRLILHHHGPTRSEGKLEIPPS